MDKVLQRADPATRAGTMTATGNGGNATAADAAAIRRPAFVDTGTAFGAEAGQRGAACHASALLELGSPGPGGPASSPPTTAETHTRPMVAEPDAALRFHAGGGLGTDPWRPERACSRDPRVTKRPRLDTGAGSSTPLPVDPACQVAGATPSPAAVGDGGPGVRGAAGGCSAGGVSKAVSGGGVGDRRSLPGDAGAGGADGLDTRQPKAQCGHVPLLSSGQQECHTAGMDVHMRGVPNGDTFSAEALPSTTSGRGIDFNSEPLGMPWAEVGLGPDELGIVEPDGGDVGGRGGSRAWHGLEGLSDEEPPSSGEWEEADEAGGTPAGRAHGESLEAEGDSGGPVKGGRSGSHATPACAPGSAAGPSAAAAGSLGPGGELTLFSGGACHVPASVQRMWLGAAPAVGMSRAVPVYGRRADNSLTSPYTVQLGSDWRLTGMEELGEVLGAVDGDMLHMTWEVMQGAGGGTAGGTFGLVLAYAGPGPATAEAGVAAATAMQQRGGGTVTAMALGGTGGQGSREAGEPAGAALRRHASAPRAVQERTPASGGDNRQLKRPRQQQQQQQQQQQHPLQQPTHVGCVPRGAEQQQGPSAVRQGGSGRVAREVVIAEPLLDDPTGGPAALPKVFEGRKTERAISVPEAAVKCLLRPEVLAEARERYAQVRASAGPRPNMLRKYIVAVYARRGSDDRTTGPYRVHLLQCRRSNGDRPGWRLSSLAELSKHLKLPDKASVRFVREVRQDRTVVLVLKPGGGQQGPGVEADLEHEGAQEEKEEEVDAGQAAVGEGKEQLASGRPAAGIGHRLVSRGVTGGSAGAPGFEHNGGQPLTGWGAAERGGERKAAGAAEALAGGSGRAATERRLASKEAMHRIRKAGAAVALTSSHGRGYGSSTDVDKWHEEAASGDGDEDESDYSGGSSSSGSSSSGSSSSSSSSSSGSSSDADAGGHGGSGGAGAARGRAATSPRRLRGCGGDGAACGHADVGGGTGQGGGGEPGGDVGVGVTGGNGGRGHAAGACRQGADSVGNGRIDGTKIYLGMGICQDLWPENHKRDRHNPDGKPRQQKLDVEVLAATAPPVAAAGAPQRAAGEGPPAAAPGMPTEGGELPRDLQRYTARLIYGNRQQYLTKCAGLVEDLGLTDDNSAMLTRLPDGRVLVEWRGLARGAGGRAPARVQQPQAEAPTTRRRQVRAAAAGMGKAPRSRAEGGEAAGPESMAAPGNGHFVGRLAMSQLYLKTAFKQQFLHDLDEGDKVEVFAAPHRKHDERNTAAIRGEGTGGGDMGGAAAGGVAGELGAGAAAGNGGGVGARYEGPVHMPLAFRNHQWYLNRASWLSRCFGTITHRGQVRLSPLPGGPGTSLLVEPLEPSWPSGPSGRSPEPADGQPTLGAGAGGGQGQEGEGRDVPAGQRAVVRREGQQPETGAGDDRTRREGSVPAGADGLAAGEHQSGDGPLAAPPVGLAAAAGLQQQSGAAQVEHTPGNAPLDSAGMSSAAHQPPPAVVEGSGHPHSGPAAVQGVQVSGLSPPQPQAHGELAAAPVRREGSGQPHAGAGQAQGQLQAPGTHAPEPVVQPHVPTREQRQQVPSGKSELPHMHQQAPAVMQLVQPQGASLPPQAQLGQNQAPAEQQPAAVGPVGLPASSLTPATLCGYVASEEQLPPVRDGELRRCGLTCHPDLAPEMRAAIDSWLQALGPGGLAEADPLSQQVYLGDLPRQVREAHRVWAQQHPHVAAALAEGQAIAERNGLGAEREWTACRVASRLGWLWKPDGGWPEGRMELEGVECFVDEQLGRRGLRARVGIRKGEPVGVVGGYVMPAGASSAFVSRGFEFCTPEVKEELGRRAGRDLAPAWRVLAWSYMGDYCAGHKLCMLGYGNLAALVNDPRVNPRAWQQGNDVGAEEGGQQQQQEPPHRGANCVVVPVVARGLVLPVLVAVRDIQPGEELLRDYGADWWRQEEFARAWWYLERCMDRAQLEQLLVGGVAGAPGE